MGRALNTIPDSARGLVSTPNLNVGGVTPQEMLDAQKPSQEEKLKQKRVRKFFEPEDF